MLTSQPLQARRQHPQCSARSLQIHKTSDVTAVTGPTAVSILLFTLSASTQNVRHHSRHWFCGSRALLCTLSTNTKTSEVTAINGSATASTVLSTVLCKHTQRLTSRSASPSRLNDSQTALLTVSLSISRVVPMRVNAELYVLATRHARHYFTVTVTCFREHQHPNPSGIQSIISFNYFFVIQTDSFSHGLIHYRNIKMSKA